MVDLHEVEVEVKCIWLCSLDGRIEVDRLFVKAGTPSWVVIQVVCFLFFFLFFVLGSYINTITPTMSFSIALLVVFFQQA